MSISNLKISNFKSFDEVEIALGSFNVLVGANASGKSNFIQLFKFLKDLGTYDLDNAVSLQGGVKYLRNMIVGASKDLSVELRTDMGKGITLPVAQKERKIYGIKPLEVTYRFALSFQARGFGFEVSEDNTALKCSLFEMQRHKDRVQEQGLGDVSIRVSRANGKLHSDVVLPADSPITVADIIPPFASEYPLGPKRLALDSPFFFLWGLRDVFRDIAIYDFDPKLPKKAVQITGRAYLEEDGSNLALVLKTIIEDPEKKRKLSNLIKDLLPFIERLDVERFADKSVLFKLREKYYVKEYLPASLISDGTIRIAELILALYFETHRLTVIEEPERNIHPYLISKSVQMMKDASRNKQIIITTHNPEIVKYAGVENILLVSRDKEGFSDVTRPADREEVKSFLENEIGVDELYAQNLLDI